MFKIRWFEWQPVLAAVGALLLLLAALIALDDALTSDAALLSRVERQVSADFQAHVARPPADAEPGAFAPPDLLLELDYRGRLLRWNTNQLLPGPQVLRRYLYQSSPILEHDNNVFYGVRRVQSARVSNLRLIPLRVRYPIQNEYLNNYLFLGRFNQRGAIRNALQSTQFELAPVREGINVRDARGTFVYGIRITDTLAFRQRQRMVACGLGAVGFLLLLGLAYQWFRTRVQRPRVLLAGLFGGLVLLRLLLLWYGFPNQYLQTPLFSARLLAVNVLSPSLGDLLINAVLLVLGVQLVAEALPLQAWGRAVVRNGKWACAGTFAGLVGLMVLLHEVFYAYVDAVQVNSKIPLDYSQIDPLAFHTMLLLLSVGLVAIALYLVVHAAIVLSLDIFRRQQLPRSMLWLLLGILLTVLWAVGNSWISVLLFGLLLLGGVMLHTQRLQISEFRVVPTLVIMALLTAIIHRGLMQANDLRTRQHLRYYTTKYAQSQDLTSEYVFDEVVRSIRNNGGMWAADSAVASRDSFPQYLVRRLTRQHLADNFPNYDFRVFIFTGDGKRLDRQPFRPYPPLDVGTRYVRRTLSKHLFRVPNPVDSAKADWYVAQFAVYSPLAGKRWVQIELVPKPSALGKVIPALLIDYSVRQRLSLPSNYEVGMYENRVLARRDGNSTIPTRLQDDIPPGGVLVESDGWFEYLLPLTGSRVVLVRANRPDWFDQLTAFSLLYYFYLMAAIAAAVPFLLRRFLGRERTLSTFTVRLQFYMALIGFLPLLSLWLPSVQLFRNLYEDDARTDLRRSLQATAVSIEQLSTLPNRLNSDAEPRADDLDYIQQLSNLLVTDINIYDLRGYLYNTTRRRVYQNTISGDYLNPTVLRTLGTGKRSEIITTERIGQLRYLSGYISLLDNQGNIAGYVNLPLLSQQGLLDEQVRKFTAYLINLYVVLILAVIVGGLFISRSLTNPLRLLQQKLDATALGLQNERLNWRSNDEIGAIIRSYNHMIEKLELSEIKLKSDEREHAWREMARQVAHEIRNPLTPMRLSIQQLQRIMNGHSMGIPPPQMVEKLSNTLLTQIENLNTIANSFANFGSMPVYDREPLEVNDVLTEVYSLYEKNEVSDVWLHLPAEAVVVRADKQQLTRVLVNLMQNATQAMADQETRGRIDISLWAEGGQAVIAVADTGCGIQPDIQHRIFEPNFSTKTSGMGLGLAITRRLVENMEGQIRFNSQAGHGTTFYITLPAHAVAA